MAAGGSRTGFPWASAIDYPSESSKSTSYQTRTTSLTSIEPEAMIPDFFVSFMSRKPMLNLHYEGAKKDSLAFLSTAQGFTSIGTVQGLGSVELYAKMKEGDFTYFTALLFPFVDRTSLRLVSDYANWVFTFDDMFDEGRFQNDRVKAFSELGGILDVMLSRPHAESNNSPLRSIFRTIWKSITENSTQEVRGRLALSIGYYCEAVARVAGAESTKYDIDTYISDRRATIGTSLWFPFIQYTYRLDIPNAYITHSAIREIEELAAEIVLLHNDVVSYHKKLAVRSEPMNIIAIYRRQGFSQQQAYNKVDGLLKERIRRWYIVLSKVPSYGERIDEQVQKYLKGCEDLVLADLYWSFHTERYFGKNPEYVRRTRRVRALF